MKLPRFSRWRARSLQALSLAIVLAVLVAARNHFRLALVVGSSMRPRYQTGDVLLVDQRAYRSTDPQRGDVVLAHYGQDLIVKRVVGVPGEEVALRHGHLYVNGTAIHEGHPIEPGPLEISPGKLLPGRYALLGDNREVGLSEGIHAVLLKREIVGRVVWSIRVPGLSGSRSGA